MSEKSLDQSPEAVELRWSQRQAKEDQMLEEARKDTSTKSEKSNLVGKIFQFRFINYIYSILNY